MDRLLHHAQRCLLLLALQRLLQEVLQQTDCGQVLEEGWTTDEWECDMSISGHESKWSL